jgi:hypothetical protein
MTTTALVKEGCGTHFVYDQGEVDRHLKLGWTIRPADWKAEKLAEDKAKRLEAVKAERARLEAEEVALSAAVASDLAEAPKNAPAELPKKRGRPVKV